MSLRQFLQVIRDNVLATYAPEDFDKDFIARRLLWRRTFVVNEPSGVRHVLLDNAQNYRKSELSRRILEPGLGRGLSPPTESCGAAIAASWRPPSTRAASPATRRS